MESAEGFGGSGVGVVREVRQQAEGACSSVVQKKKAVPIIASSPAFWSKIPDPELSREGCRSSSLQDDDVSKDHGLGNTNSPLTLDLEAKLVLKKSGKRVKSNGVCGKRSGMVQMDVSRRKVGLDDANGISVSLASSPASCNTSEKTQVVKQKNNCRCGDKRNSKVHRNRCDSFSLKNGFAGFKSTAGGNNFFGLYGLKTDIFDITKYVNELSLDELLRGHDSNPSIAKDKGKIAANSNDNLLQSVRKACSVLQDRRFCQAQKHVENDNSCVQKFSTGSMTASSAAEQTDYEKRDSCTAELPSPDKVKNSDDEIAASNSVADRPLYLPKDILERLALPAPKDLDLLLSDASKTTSCSKNCIDPRLGKSNFQRVGLPPFSWSHSFSGHNKLGTDSVKLSANRSMCHGRWFKVESSTTTLQKGSVDLALDFESLAFDQSLVPKVNLTSKNPDNESAAIERVLSSGACSTSSIPADEHSPTYAAAKTLCEMATYSSKENLSAMVKLLKKPCKTAMSPWKLKAGEKSHKLFDAPKSTLRPHNPVKVCGDGFPSKKLRLSADVTNAYVGHIDSVRRGTLHWSAPPSATSSHRKLVRHSNAGTDSFGVTLVNKSYVMKPPRGGDRPSSSSQQKIRKVVPVECSRPES